MLLYVPWSSIITLLTLAQLNESLLSDSLTFFIPGIKYYDAVTRFEGLERYYRLIIHRNKSSNENLDEFRASPTSPVEPQSPKEELKVVIGLCKSIFSSHYFDMRQEDYMDGASDEVQAKVRAENPRLFRSIYRQTATGDYKYDYFYTERRVRIRNEQFDEHTITCITQGRTGGKIREYFVSKLYDINTVYRGNTMLGRFIFTRDDQNDLTPLALAEEAAESSDFLRYTGLIEWFYLKRNSEEKPPSTDLPSDQNPLCRLRKAYKLRLCASIFGALVFNVMKLKFTPTMAHVHEVCVKKRIAFIAPGTIPFVGELVRSVASKTRSYEEWVMGCSARTHEGVPVMYYVSYARQKHEAFVFADYAGIDDRMVLHTWFPNVSVVGNDFESDISSVHEFLANEWIDE